MDFVISYVPVPVRTYIQVGKLSHRVTEFEIPTYVRNILEHIFNMYVGKLSTTNELRITF